MTPTERFVAVRRKALECWHENIVKRPVSWPCGFVAEGQHGGWDGPHLALHAGRLLEVGAFCVSAVRARDRLIGAQMYGKGDTESDHYKRLVAEADREHEDASQAVQAALDAGVL